MLELLTHLDRRAFAPVLCGMRVAKGQPLDHVRDLGIPIVDLQVPPTLKGLGLPKSVLRLSREFRRLGTRVVHSYLFHGNFLGTLAARLARVPVALVSKRSLDTYPKLSDRLACRVANRLADRVTANSEAVRRHVHEAEGCALDKIVVIPNGVDLTRFPAVESAATTARATLAIDPPTSRPIVGTVARLAPKKGQHDLIEAAALVVRRRPDATFVLVGGGPLLSDLRTQADGLGLNGSVRFLGAVDDPIPLLSRMDVFVLSSHMEGMSNAMLEAMAAGRPVVATRVGGNAEVVEDGVTGFLVPPRDPARLAEAMLTLLDDPARASAMGVAGRARVETHYAVGPMVGRLEDLYRQELARKGAAGD